MTISHEPSWKLVRKYMERAKRERGKVRKQIAAELDVSPPALSAWTTDSDQPKISPAQVQPFAKAVGMTEHEIVELAVIRYMEENGKNPVLDLELLTRVITYPMPEGDDKVIIDILKEETTAIGFNYRLFDSEESRQDIRATIQEIVKRECESIMADC